jgi:hypothetical protein
MSIVSKNSPTSRSLNNCSSIAHVSVEQAFAHIRRIFRSYDSLSSLRRFSLISRIIVEINLLELIKLIKWLVLSNLVDIHETYLIDNNLEKKNENRCK